jgi:hypothetical protein
MEYITTYGWAILVVVIIGIVIWQLGLFDFQSRFAPGSSGFSMLVPRDWEVRSAGGGCTLSVQLYNGAGEGISDAAIGGGSCAPTNVSTGSYTICGKTVGNCGGGGSAYEEKVVVTYSAHGQSFQTAGVIWGNVGG